LPLLFVARVKISEKEPFQVEEIIQKDIVINNFRFLGALNT